MWYPVAAHGYGHMSAAHDITVRSEEGQSRLGDYTIEGVLGEGGGGVVYAAVGPDGEVALKVTHEDRELTSRDRDRYLAEAEMMRRVRHDAIVDVLDAGLLPDGRPFVAMPRLEGETLAERITRRGPLSLDEALNLFEQLADATMALHACGLLHRDLKAENVFLTPGGRLKLLDFGIAKDQRASQVHTTTGLVRGTPATMAPERFFGEPASEQSDVYELAVVFYVMVAGKLPWAGDETDVRARAHPVALHQARPEVPPTLGCALMAALATRPEPRPCSPLALSTALREAAREPSLPTTALGGPTVTSDNLRQLVAYETPFEAAVASRPHPAPAASSRSWLALPVVAAVAAAAFLAWSPSDAVAPARSGLNQRLGTIHGLPVPAAPEPAKPRAHAQPVPVETKAEAEPTKPAAATPAREKTPEAKPARKPVAAPAAVNTPAAEPVVDPVHTPAPIPGGVHGASPY